MASKTAGSAVVSIDDLRVLAGGNFFKIGASFSEKSIESFFKQIRKKWGIQKPVLEEIDQDRSCKAGRFKYSFLSIKLPACPPPFFPNSEDLKEIRYGFVLIIQFGDTIAVFKRGPMAFENWVGDHCVSIEAKALLRIFGTDAIYQKLSLRRMTISRSELRSTSYEAEDLSTTIPTLGLGRSVPRFVRLDHKKAGAVSITPSTSRVQKSGGRLNIDELADAVASISQEFITKQKTPLLDALPIPEEKLPSGINPTGILFELPLQGDQTSTWEVWEEKDGKKVDVTQAVRQKFLPVLPVKAGMDNWKFEAPHSAAGTFTLPPKVVMDVKDIETLTVKDEDGDEETFSVWIKRNKPYSVCFDTPEWFYTHGQLYRRADFAKDIDLIRNALFPSDDMLKALTEKGEKKGQKYNDKSTAFRDDSIFGVVEKVLCKTDQHLFCADLNDEWADYIAINGPTNGGVIRFLHCKDGDVTSGASAFHEVTGQALKNLGRLQITPKDFSEKLDELLAKKHWKENVPIPRYRGPGNVQSDIATLIASPETKKEVILAVTFASKIRFDTEAAQKPLEPHFIQMIWIVSAFLHSCREMGAVGKIICKP